MKIHSDVFGTGYLGTYSIRFHGPHDIVVNRDGTISFGEPLEVHSEELRAWAEEAIRLAKEMNSAPPNT